MGMRAGRARWALPTCVRTCRCGSGPLPPGGLCQRASRPGPGPVIAGPGPVIAGPGPVVAGTAISGAWAARSLLQLASAAPARRPTRRAGAAETAGPGNLKAASLGLVYVMFTGATGLGIQVVRRSPCAARRPPRHPIPACPARGGRLLH